jgi:signal transduction histidine kinase
VRLDAARSASGSGLGLSLVAVVAQLHGAELTLGDAGPGLVVSLDLRRTTRARIPEHEGSAMGLFRIRLEP